MITVVGPVLAGTACLMCAGRQSAWASMCQHHQLCVSGQLVHDSQLKFVRVDSAGSANKTAIDGCQQVAIISSEPIGTTVTSPHLRSVHTLKAILLPATDEDARTRPSPALPHGVIIIVRALNLMSKICCTNCVNCFYIVIYLLVGVPPSMET